MVENNAEKREVVRILHSDLDGSACENTEIVAFEGVRRAMIKYAPDLETALPDAQKLAEQYAGSHTKHVIEEICKDYGKDILVNIDLEKYVEEALEETDDLQVEAMKTKAVALGGLDDLLTDPMLDVVSIVSTSPMNRIVASLQGCNVNGLKYQFNNEQLISASDTVKEEVGVPMRKPNPASYLLALYKHAYQPVIKLNYPSDTLFKVYRLEDSANGVQSAMHAAGLHDGKQRTEQKTPARELLEQEGLAPFKGFLEKRGELSGFASFLDNNVESHTIGLDSCSHIPAEKKPAHRQKLLDMGVDTVVSSVPEIRHYIMST